MHRLPEEFGHEQTRWTLDTLLSTCDWLDLQTPAGLWQVLKRLGIHYKRARHYLHSPDENYVMKLLDVKNCVEQSQATPQEVIVLFQDELTFYRHPGLAHSYEKTGKIQALANLGLKSNRSWRVAGAIEIWTGKVFYLDRSRLRLSALVAFYQKIATSYPDAKTIYMIQDNWPIHFHPDVLAAFLPQQTQWELKTPSSWPTGPSKKAKSLGLPIQLVPLPTYAPWTNPIEKLWRKLKQEILHLHRYEDDWIGLRQRVRKFLDQFEQGSPELVRYIGLENPLSLYHSLSPEAP